MTEIRTQLVDEVPYASPNDVLTYVRNRDTFKSETDSNPTDPTTEEVHSLLLDRSEFIDNRTNRAWRTRKVPEYWADVKLSYLQKNPKFRRRSLGRRGGRTTNLRDPRKIPDPHVPAQLPHLNLRTIDSNQGDKVEVVKGRNVEDITSSKGIENGKYYLKNSHGRVMVALGTMTTTGVSYMGQLTDDDFTLRITYRYGTDESTAASNYDTSAAETDTSTSTYARTEHTPEDVRRATAKLVAADLFRSDQYGEILPAAGGDSVDVGEAADSFVSSAMDTINEFRRRSA